jgi:hypothetical protein
MLTAIAARSRNEGEGAGAARVIMIGLALASTGAQIVHARRPRLFHTEQGKIFVPYSAHLNAGKTATVSADVTIFPPPP